MANETSTLISSVTIGAGGLNNITFSAIPQTYTDLMVLISARSGNTTLDAGFKINGSYPTLYVTATGSGTAKSSTNSGVIGTNYGWYIPQSGYLANTFGNTMFYFYNYTSTTDKYLSIDTITDTNAAQAYMGMGIGRQTSSVAITSLAFYCDPATTFPQNSTAYLYGIKK